MSDRQAKKIITALFALAASVALSNGWNGTALFFALWTIAGLLETTP